MKKLIICILLLLPSASPGAVEGPKHRIVELGANLLTAAPLNVTQTLSLPANVVAGYSILVLHIEHINSNASRVDVICRAEREVPTTTVGAGTLYDLQSCTVAAGVCTSDDAVVRKSVSGNKNYVARFGILGAFNITCDFTSVAGDGSDTVTVKGSMVTG